MRHVSQWCKQNFKVALQFKQMQKRICDQHRANTLTRSSQRRLRSIIVMACSSYRLRFFRREHLMSGGSYSMSAERLTTRHLSDCWHQVCKFGLKVAPRLRLQMIVAFRVGMVHLSKSCFVPLNPQSSMVIETLIWQRRIISA